MKERHPLYFIIECVGGAYSYTVVASSGRPAFACFGPPGKIITPIRVDRYDGALLTFYINMQWFVERPRCFFHGHGPASRILKCDIVTALGELVPGCDIERHE